MVEEQFMSLKVLYLASRDPHLQVIAFLTFIGFNFLMYIHILFETNGVVDNTSTRIGGGALSLRDYNALYIHGCSFTSNKIFP